LMKQLNLKKYLETFDMNKFKFKKLNNLKNPNRFEIIETRKGVLFFNKVSETFDAESNENYDNVTKLLNNNNNYLTTEEAQAVRRDSNPKPENK